MRNGMRPIHPGEVLREEFLEPLEMSASALARALLVAPNRITALLNEQRAITADTAMRLARYFGTTAEFWMALQQAYDLRTEEREATKSTRGKIVPHAIAKRPVIHQGAGSRPSQRASA